MKKEKSILIIENSNHYHVLDHLCDFYKNKGYEVTLALTWTMDKDCLLYTSPSPRDRTRSRMPSSA